MTRGEWSGVETDEDRNLAEQRDTDIWKWGERGKKTAGKKKTVWGKEKGVNCMGQFDDYSIS